MIKLKMILSCFRVGVLDRLQLIELLNKIPQIQDGRDTRIQRILAILTRLRLPLDEDDKGWIYWGLRQRNFKPTRSYNFDKIEDTLKQHFIACIQARGNYILAQTFFAAPFLHYLSLHRLLLSTRIGL